MKTYIKTHPQYRTKNKEKHVPMSHVKVSHHDAHVTPLHTDPGLIYIYNRYNQQEDETEKNASLPY